MVDWEWVDRRRAEGASWEEIARDPRTGFSAEPGGPSPGMALRRSFRARRAEAEPADPQPPARERSWTLARVGWVLGPLLLPWAALAYLFPSPVGVYLPVLPILGFLAAAGALVLAFGLLRTHDRWNARYRATAGVALAVGLALAGTLAAVAAANGCPRLSPFTTPEPGGWVRVGPATWQSGGAPVLFFYGSVACPYCSASSWAVLAALERLGTVSHVTYEHSSPTDVYPNTPSVVLSALALESGSVSLDARESTNDQQITAPATGNCLEQAYLSAYDPFGAIPFVVVGGVFVHAAGTLVDPAAFVGLNASGVQAELAGHAGSAYSAVSGAEAYLLAYVVYLDHGEPAAVASDPAVAAVLSQIR